MSQAYRNAGVNQIDPPSGSDIQFYTTNNWQITSSDSSLVITGTVGDPNIIDFTAGSGVATNSFVTISTPSGTSPVADSSSDTLTLTSTGITITGTAGSDTIDFTATPTTIGVLSFSTISTTSGTAPVADSATDTLTLSAGAGLTVTGDSTTDTVTFANTGALTAFVTIDTPAGTDVVADAASDTLTLTSTGITITGTAATDTIDFTATPTTIGVLSFSTIDTPAGTDVVADSATDTLTLTATGITITGTAASDTIDFTATPTTIGVLSFSTIDCSSGTDPVADSPTDTLVFTGGTGVTVTGDSAADSVTWALDINALTTDTIVSGDFVPFADITESNTPNKTTFANFNAALDHNTLTNLTTGDVHTHYFLNSGRSGGQTATGGTAASNNLTLRSTSNATKGTVLLDETTDSTSHTAGGALRTSGGVSIAKKLHVGTNAYFGGQTESYFGTGTTFGVYNLATPSGGSSLIPSFISIEINPAAGFTAEAIAMQMQAFSNDGTVKSLTASFLGFSAEALEINATSWTNIIACRAGATQGGAGTATNLIGLTTLLTSSAGTVTNAIGVDVNEPSASGGTITNKVGVSVDSTLSISKDDVATTATINSLSDRSSVIRLTGSTATQINGITGGWSTKGQKLKWIYNQSTALVTIAHQNASAAASDRIITPRANSVPIHPSDWAHLYYDVGDSRWVLNDTRHVIQLQTNTTAVGNVGTGEDDLITYSLPASSLGTNGDYVEIIVWGTFAANANSKRVRVYFGATAVFDTTALAFNGVDWKAEARVVRTGAATQEAGAAFFSNTALLTSIANQSNPAETLSGAITIKCTGEATSNNDIVQEGLIVKWNRGI